VPLPACRGGTGFVAGMTVVGPMGVTFSSVTVHSATSATALMSAASTATTGTNLPVTVVDPTSAGAGRGTWNGLTVT